MKSKNRKFKTLKVIFISTAIVGLLAWDMAYNNKQSVIEGTFRVDSLFNFPSPRAQKVAVIASDNALLPNPAPVTATNLSYQQIKSMVKQAIDLIGGISAFVHEGDTVLIKPNIVGAKATGDGENTDIRVVKSIISIIYETYQNKCKIYIGEGSARSNATMGGENWNAAGYDKLSLDADLKGINFELVDLNDEVANGINLVHVPTKASLAYAQNGKYWIHKYLTSPNIKFINVPVLKMHEPGITNALKNQIGVAAGAKYGWNKVKGGPGGKLIHHAEFTSAYNYKSWQDEEIVDLCSCINNFTLNVVDALLCLETQKTLMSGGSNQVRLNTIIAGADPVAVDHVCARIIGSNPDDIAHLTMSEKIGLGTNNSDSIGILGEDIASKYKYRFVRGAVHAQYGQGNRIWIISPAFSYSTMSNDYLGGESALNPQKGDSKWSAPIYFFDDRIDLNSYLNPNGNVVAYCFSNVYAPVARKNVELWLNSEEDMTVFLNGKTVYNYSGSRPNANLVADKPLIDLHEGENRILVKVLQRTGCFDFALNICEPGTNGNRVEGLKFYIKNYNEPTALTSGNQTINYLSNKDFKILIKANYLFVDDIDVSDLVLYNPNGIKIASANGNKIFAGNLNKGIYIIGVKFRNGMVVNRKIFKN